MKIILLTILFISLQLFVDAQDAYKVKAEEGFSIRPQKKILFKNVKKRFIIHIPSQEKIDHIEFTTGNFWLNDSILALQPTGGKIALLRIYRKTKLQPQLVISCSFDLVDVVEPTITIDGVKNDSATQLYRITAMGKIKLERSRGAFQEQQVEHKIISFQLNLADGTSIKGTGNQLSNKQRIAIYNQGENTSVSISSIKYLFGTDTLALQKPFRVYIIKNEVTKFGF
ncbi:MAG: hypothetical protein RL708_2677 [Bacteroidota bacterium]|jgi:hypothetical protein